ncbi:unnamed protein product [Angiostrongylus costaricensis]|uniref:Uncharacterized protein n=1 Tax=Angiostrongylus costaricensis TaxID=334426 RepID=A0A158PD74_ANGCS|nr:unnamed protein product [Angiostrongylus costaricensis]
MASYDFTFCKDVMLLALASDDAISEITYFSSSNDESKSRCEDECEECVGDIFGNLPKDQQPACNLRCGVRPRLWASIGLFCVFAAACATLLFTIPMCIATCASCLHAKKANKNAKRVMLEQQAQPSKDQQVATMGYNPYAYWPYYGRA